MSDPFVNPIFGERGEPATEALEVEPDEAEVEVEGTGQTDVDAVVASLTRLDDLPVAEHVAVFEQAHESLRRTLVGAGEADSLAADRS